MNILFATAQPFPPQIAGGMQICVDGLIKDLGRRGHHASLLCGLSGKGYLAFRDRILLKVTGRKNVRDSFLGYPVWRGWFPWESVAEITARTRPDVIVVPCGQPARVAIAAKATGIPVVMWLQDVEFGNHGGDFNILGNIPCIANSNFTAERYRNNYNVDPQVIHPVIDAGKYKTETNKKYVTFINPHPYKGVRLALDIAEKCPDIPFAFVESWTLEPADRVYLEERLATLPNVTLHPPVRDMKKIYSQTRILLAPSQWEEAYGRIASEAQFSGIPVIASKRGGLPEAVGPGGILLNADDPAEIWALALQKLWHDEASYAALSEKALEHSKRAALNTETQYQSWEKTLLQAAGHTS
ncbi:MAG: mshA 1 [Micavibrio sp.]|nr:mshA 1 [Micavibrio sp.]